MVTRLQNYLAIRYALRYGKKRNFDPEGFISCLRAKIKRGSFNHDLDLNEDVIRNSLTTDQSLQRRKKWSILTKIENETRAKFPNFQGFFSKEKGPIIRIEIMFDKFKSIHIGTYKIEDDMVHEETGENTPGNYPEQQQMPFQ